MRQRRLSRGHDGGSEFPVSDFALLARELRRRQHLTRPTQPTARLPEAIPSEEAAPAKSLDEVQSRRPEALPPPGHASSPQLHGSRRSAHKEGKKTRYGSRDTQRQRHRRSTSERNDSSSNHRRQPKINSERQVRDDLKLDPSVEAAMLRVFSGKGRSRGVSVSAIRSLYRKRHEEEQARAMEEVRRWWRVGRCEKGPLAEATVAASLMLASRGGEAQNIPGGVTGVGLAEDGRVLQERDHQNLANDASDDISTSTADGSHGSLSRRESRDRAEEPYRVFDDLDCRQVLHDPSYTARVVRDVKQALRGGQSVKIRSRQEPSLERRNSTDSQLMLRTLYMQCVRVSFEGAKCEQSLCICTSRQHEFPHVL